MKKLLLLPIFLVSFVALFSCHSDTSNPARARKSLSLSSRNQLIRRLLETMTLEQKAAQVLMTGIDGKVQFPAYSEERFQGMVPGAVILFRSNIGDTPQGVFEYLRSCNQAFLRLGSPLPVLYAIDHEGGDVYRTGKLTTRLPSARFVAEHLSLSDAQALYAESARQLALMGIRLNLAPVAELNLPTNQAFLGTRAYSASRKTVVEYARSALLGYRAGGVLTVLKHFPGNAEGDPHSLLPVLDVTDRNLESLYVGVFRDLIKDNPDAILVSHIKIPSIDPGLPFCLSRKGVTGLLRDKLKFRGLILTDDISMAALSKSGYAPKEASVMALEAGCDMIMITDRNFRPVVQAIVTEAATKPHFAERLDQAVTAVIRLKLDANKIVDKSFDSKDVFNLSDFTAARSRGERLLEEIK